VTGRDATPLPARVGRFLIRGELGRGGGGVVYRAFDPDRQGEIALKVLLAGEHASAANVERFLREARATARIDHPHVVRVHDCGWVDGRPWLAMDLVEGPTLAQVMEQRAVPLDEALRVGRDLAAALSAAHAVGVVHRDVKPGNVLFTASGRPMLGDFGVAAEVGAESRLTQTGQVVGTPAYVAPEATRRATPHPTADVYSLGAVLYHLLAGRPPYEGQTGVEVLYALMDGPPPPLRSVAPQLPLPVARVVEAAMAREPEHRYPSAELLRQDLDALLDGRAPQPPTLSVAATWRQRGLRWRRSLLVGAGLLGAVGLAVVGTRAWQHRVTAMALAERESAAAAALDALGDADREARLLAFAADPAVQGTEALGRAWLELGERAAGTEEATERYANAYLVAGPAAQDEALRGLAREFRRSWRFASLAAVLTQLDRRTPGAEDRPDIASLRADEAMVRRDWAAASAALQAAGRPGAALVERWTRATRMGGNDQRGHVVDTDGDGVAEWWRTRSDRALVRTRLDRLDVDEVVTTFEERPWTYTVLPGDPPLLVASDGAAPTSVEVRPLGAGAPYRWPDSPHTSAVTLPDGALLVAIGAYARHLVRLDPDGSGWRRSAPLPEVDATRSDVTALALPDTDGDGHAELVVASGAWSAYDLRSYAPPFRDPAAWRRKVGFVVELVVEPRPGGDAVWSLHSEEYGSLTMFPREQPFGAPAGATRWVRDGDGLRPERELLAVRGDGPVLVRNLVVADLDGDGVVDPAFAVRGPDDRWLTTVFPGGSGEPVWIGDASPLFAADLGPEPGAELVVRIPAEGEGGTWWVLGTGDEGLPPPPAPARQGEPPDGLPPTATGAWRRAEDLASMGLFGPAADHLVHLGRASSLPEALERAAALSADAGDPDRSSALRWDAARMAQRADRLAEVAALLQDRHQLSASAQARAEAGLPPDPALDEAVRRGRTLALAAGDWPGPLTVSAPEHVRATPAGAELQLVSGDGPIAVLPVTTDGGELGLRLRFDTRRSEWGSGFVARLDGPAGPLEVALRVWGGGGTLRRELSCTLPDGDSVTLEDTGHGAEASETRSAAIDVSTLAGTWICRLERGDVARTASGRLPEPVAGGPATLSLGPSDHAGVFGLVAELTLRELSVSGTGLAARPAEPVAPRPLREAWAAGDPGALDRALAATALSPGVEDELRCFLRSRPTLAGPAVRARWPERFPGWFLDAWGTAFHAHPDDASLSAVWLAETPSAEAWLGGPAHEAAAQVLLRRAQAWLATRQPAAAERELQQATAALPPPRARELGVEVELATTWVDLAALAAATGSPLRADPLATARTYVPDEIVDDLVAARSSLR
jgi:hypothetical protein